MLYGPHKARMFKGCSMQFPALQQYLARLAASPQDTTMWLDGQGRAHGRYFNSTLTSAFQPIRVPEEQRIVGVQAFVRSHSSANDGLSLWKMLDTVATDVQSIELDRLCRLLHVVNFYRQPEMADVDLYLSIHPRLLGAVDSNHGMSFRHVLDVLELPHRKIVLQLPPSEARQAWLLNYVADNYRRNAFRLALNVADARQGLVMLAEIRPDAIKVDTQDMNDKEAIRRLLRDAARAEVRVVFKRIESASVYEGLLQLGKETGQSIAVQGHLWDTPQSALADISHEVAWPDASKASIDAA
jgi:EAL domain-containing protein (putative c-di-GMP-specific phosphodiesterase class I)